MNQIKRWEKHRFQYGVCNVEMMYDHFFKYLLGKCHQLFKWEGLPETIDEAYLNNTLFLDGDIGWTEIDGALRALEGHQGGEIDCYHYGTRYLISNPIAGTKDCKVNEDCVVMYNADVDKARFLGGGLYSLISSTATLLADNLVSINCAQINTRVQTVITAPDDTIARAAEIVLKDKYNGKPYAVVTDDITDNTITVTSTPNGSGTITELVELQLSIMANFYNAVGIKMNAIRKKQRMITDEINAQDNYIGISIDEMLKARQTAVEKINAMFGTSISVCINPILDDVKEDFSIFTSNNIDENNSVAETSSEATPEPQEEPEQTSDTNDTTDVTEPTESIEEKALEIMSDQLQLMATIIEEGVEEDEPEQTVSDCE